MATKYELATELRKLAKDMKPLPISKMKKGELLKAIDAVKQINAEKEALETPEVKPGPLAPRPVKTIPKQIDSSFIKAPEIPKPRILAPKPREEIEIIPASVPKLALKRVETLGADDEHKCNCALCPLKKKK